MKLTREVGFFTPRCDSFLPIVDPDHARRAPRRCNSFFPISCWIPGDASCAATRSFSPEPHFAQLRRAQPDISLAWIARNIPIKQDADREHYLEGFRRAGLD
jgi:hypothetical protein